MRQYVPQATSDKTFQLDVLNNDKLTLVDFWADWCGPCRNLAPLLDELAEEYGGKVEIKKIHADENPQSIQQYGIRALPTLVLFDNGKPVETVRGLQPRAQLVDFIERHLAS